MLNLAGRLAISTTVILAGRVTAFAQEVDSSAIDYDALSAQLDQVREDWGVPGMAIAIIDGDGVWMQGFGTRTIGQDEPVDAHTLFAIGSSTKAFTSAAIGALVDAGDVKWGGKASEYLPWLRLYDDYANSELTVRDMLSHRSGLSRGDFLWYATDLSREEIVRKMRGLEPSWSFRSQFGYQNLMYIAAGLIIEEQTGETWDDFIAEIFFVPLEMDESNTSVTALSGLDNVASPHAEIDDETIAVDYRNIDNAGPAGSINSNVDDMSHWVQMLLADGEYGGEKVISKSVIEQVWSPHTIVPGGPTSSLNTETNFTLYGMGWFLQDYRGEKLVQHGGNIDGMSALVSMLPDRDLGMVILTNLNGTPATTVVQNIILDAALGADDHDWSAEYRKTIDTLREQGKKQEEEQESKRVADTTPTLGLDAYTGTYEHELYGPIEISMDGDALVFTRGALVADLEHWNYDTFRAVMRNPVSGKPLVTFYIGADGEVESLSTLGEDDWMKQPAPVEADESIALTDEDKQGYVGVYSSDALPVEMTVEVIDGELKFNVTGQPSVSMLPTGVDQFNLGDLPPQITVVVQFHRDDAGAVTGMTFKQTPGGTFEMTKQAE